MTLEEFISLDPAKIRRDKDLMQLFVSFYKAAFSLTPNCAGCVFNRGFAKLKRFAGKGEKKVNFIEKTIMEKTFVVKAQYRGKILTYKENGTVFRKYGNSLTEEFARKLVEHGKSEVFATPPQDKKDIKNGWKAVVSLKDGTTELYNVSPDEITFKDDSLESMDWKEDILPLYAELKSKTGKKAVSRSKKDVIAFINENK